MVLQAVIKGPALQIALGMALGQGIGSLFGDNIVGGLVGGVVGVAAPAVVIVASGFASLFFAVSSLFGGAAAVASPAASYSIAEVTTTSALLTLRVIRQAQDDVAAGAAGGVPVTQVSGLGVHKTQFSGDQTVVDGAGPLAEQLLVAFRFQLDQLVVTTAPGQCLVAESAKS